MEMTPIVVDGMMFITTGDDDVFALNPATGAQIWHYHPSDMVKISTLPVCCNNDNRGVAVGGGMVFDARLDAQLVALNEKTGAVVWQTIVDLPSNGAGRTLAPQYISASAGTVPEGAFRLVTRAVRQLSAARGPNARYRRNAPRRV